MSTLRLLAFVGLVALLARVPATAQDPAGDEARAVRLWEQRRQAVPLARYSLRWEHLAIRPRPGTPKPGEDGAFTGTGVLTLDGRNSRLRLDRDERLHLANRPERLSRVRLTLRSDGREQSSATAIDPDAGTAPAEPDFRDVHVAPWGRGGASWPRELHPLLWAHGLIWNQRDGSAGLLPFDWRPAPGRFRPEKGEVVGGRPCIVLRDAAAPEGTTETLWIDAEHGGVVRHRIVRGNGTTSETAVTYQPTARGWLPLGWTTSDGKPGREPVVGLRVKVEEVTFDPPATDDEFRIVLRPGMSVSRPGEKFTVRADGGLEEVDTRAEAGLPPRTFPGRVARAVGWVGAVWFLAAAMLGGALVRLRRRYRPPATPGPG